MVSARARAPAPDVLGCPGSRRTAIPSSISPRAANGRLAWCLDAACGDAQRGGAQHRTTRPGSRRRGLAPVAAHNRIRTPALTESSPMRSYPRASVSERAAAASAASALSNRCMLVGSFAAPLLDGHAQKDNWRGLSVVFLREGQCQNQRRTSSRLGEDGAQRPARKGDRVRWVASPLCWTSRPTTTPANFAPPAKVAITTVFHVEQPQIPCTLAASAAQPTYLGTPWAPLRAAQARNVSSCHRCTLGRSAGRTGAAA